MYDHKKDYEEYMGGAQDFAHARLAKKLMDKKRKMKMMGGHSEEHESMADEMSESPAEQSMEAAAGTEKHHKISIDVTPEELAQLKAMRSGKA